MTGFVVVTKKPNLPFLVNKLPILDCLYRSKKTNIGVFDLDFTFGDGSIQHCKTILRRLMICKNKGKL